MLALYDATYKFSKTTIFHTLSTKICIKMQFTIKYLNMQLWFLLNEMKELHLLRLQPTCMLNVNHLDANNHDLESSPIQPSIGHA